jgi:WD40 repeat protein
MVYQTEDLGAAVSGLAFSPDGLNLASVDAVNGVVLRETASGRPTSSEIPLWNYARTVAFSPDGLVMAVASQGGIVEERGPRTGNLVARYDSLGDYVYSLAYRADGSLVALTCRQGDLRVRDGRTGQILLSSPSGLDMCEPSIMTRLNHNGTYAVVAFWRAHGWRLWHLATNSWLAFAEPIFVGGTSFTRDDQHVAILAHSSVQLWNMDGDLVLDTDRDPSHDLGNVMDLALSQDGERYVIGGPEILTGLMEEYSAPRSIRVGDGGSDMARAVAVGHDADLIAASLYPLETATALYDIDTGRRLVALPHHLTDIWPRLEFSPDGSLLLDFSEIGTVLIWGLR